jgi:ABC-2 type transport system ATP-binding protein
MDAISLNDVRKTYPGVEALKGISFHVKKGSVHGFLGPNGAGKSTTMKILAGLISPTSGEVEVLGERLPEGMDIIKSNVGFLPEHPPLYPNMKVIDYLNFVYRINTLKRSAKTMPKGNLLERCGLDKVQNRLIRNLSKGYQQRVGIAQAMIYNPDILILDEPTVGLDPKAMNEIRELIISLREDHTILFSSHLLHEVDLLCSDITIINSGSIVQSGSIDEIRGRLQSRQVIFAEVNTWNEGLGVKACQQLGFERVEESSPNRLAFYSSSNDDLRSSLGTFLVESGCGLLELREQKLELENIFKLVTEENHDQVR